MSLHDARPRGARVDVPPEVIAQIKKLRRERGGLTALALRAGVSGAYFNRLAKGHATRVAGDTYPRLIAALKGEEVPETEALKRWQKRREEHNRRRRRGKWARRPTGNPPGRPPRLALAAHDAGSLIAVSQQNGHSQTELLRLLDGLTLGVEITRRTVFEHLGIVGKE